VKRDKKLPISDILPQLRQFRKSKGGRNLVDGWAPAEWSSFGEYIQEGFDNETLVHSSFESVQDAFKFINGIGEYSDRNSFFYNPQDRKELQDEGYFQIMQCPKCLEDLKSQLEGEEIPDEEVVDPQIYPVESEYQGKSFKPDEEKYVKKLFYSCRDHSEVYLMKEESWYE